MVALTDDSRVVQLDEKPAAESVDALVALLELRKEL